MPPDHRRIELRVPAELRERLDAAAAESGRSLNAEVVARLAASFECEAVLDPVTGSGAVLAALLDHLGLEYDERARAVRPRR